MDAVTYPDDDVQRFLAERVVAVKPQIDQETELAKRYGAVWTPGLVWMTPDGKACHQNVGFFEPAELLAESVLALGRVAGGRSDWKEARERFDEVTRTWPDSHAAPAALYWAGVAAKKDSGEVDGLMAAWKQLRKDHPDSAWATKVSFIEDS
jgi:hypothetical protein